MNSGTLRKISHFLAPISQPFIAIFLALVVGGR